MVLFYSYREILFKRLTIEDTVEMSTTFTDPLLNIPPQVFFKLLNAIVLGFKSLKLAVNYETFIIGILNEKINEFSKLISQFIEPKVLEKV